MKIKYNKKTIPYLILITIVIFVELHYLYLFRLPDSIDFILYENRAKWIGLLLVIAAYICYRNHKTIIAPYMKFLKKYYIALLFSLVLICFYTTIKYPLNSLITTYGFAALYLYSFLAIPIIYVFEIDNGIDRFMKLLNIITFIMSVVTIIQLVYFRYTGALFFENYGSVGYARNGSLRLDYGALATITLIYNVFQLYNKRIRKKIFTYLLIISQLIVLFLAGNSRVYILSLLCAVGSLILLGDGSSKKKLLTAIIVVFAIVALIRYDIIGKLTSSLSMSGDYAGSTYARLEAFKYYFNMFLKNPIFAIGFAGDDNYYNLIHNGGHLVFQTVDVNLYYSDVGIIGQLALLGIFVINIYIWPLFRFIHEGFVAFKRKFSEAPVLVSIAVLLIVTTPTFIILDNVRMISFPLVIAIFEYYHIVRIRKKNVRIQGGKE